MRTGFYIVGVLKGYKASTFTNRETGEVKDKHNIGIQLQDPDGYGGYNTTTQEIKVDFTHVNGQWTAGVKVLHITLMKIQ